MTPDATPLDRSRAGLYRAGGMARPITALVTGSTRGIGAAIAGGLVARGCRVIGHARSAQAVPGQEAVIAADFSAPGAPQALWQEAVERAGGRIDLLVSNAGLFVPNPIDASDIAWLDGWEDTVRVNLTAAAQLA